MVNQPLIAISKAIYLSFVLLLLLLMMMMIKIPGEHMILPTPSPARCNLADQLYNFTKDG
jgi:hypothetical protein